MFQHVKLIARILLESWTLVHGEHGGCGGGDGGQGGDDGGRGIISVQLAPLMQRVEPQLEPVSSPSTANESVMFEAPASVWQPSTHCIGA